MRIFKYYKPNHENSIFQNKTLNIGTLSYFRKIENDVEGANSAYLMIVGASNYSSSNNYIINCTQTQISINVSNYQMGIYTVALVVDGQIVDAMALMIQ